MKMRAVMRRLLRLAREERGAELVEFAMTALILVGLTVGVIGFGLAMYTYHFLSTAAQQGTRFAIVRGDTWSTYETVSCSTSAPPDFTMVYDCTASNTDIQNYVQSLATLGISPSSVTVNTTVTNPSGMADDTATGCTTSTDGKGCLVKVKVSYSFNFFPSQQLSALSISATSEGVTLQ